MRHSTFCRLMILCAILGCNESGVGKPSADSAKPSQSTPRSRRGTESGSTAMRKNTESYWNKCIDVNDAFVVDKGDVWFKEFRPAIVGKTCRDAAKRLREIDNSGTDPEVIDHVNRVIRGYEQMGAIAETKGKESLWRDATAAVAFVIKVARATRPPGAVADAGSLAMGIGASEQGGKATREGQAQTIGIANKLMESEEEAIRHVRKTYSIELKPW